MALIDSRPYRGHPADFSRFRSGKLRGSSAPPKRFMLKLAGSFFVALFSLSITSAGVAAEKEVELLTDAEFLQPTSTFEFRFARPVATREDVGTVASKPPITIEPALAGTFTWLSQRSGVFVPKAPPPLGTEFVIT